MPDWFNAEISPYIGMLIGLVISLWAKDFAVSYSTGLAFKYNPQFNEGDHVLIDDEPALIVKIGVRYTVFSVVKADGTQIWRYVKNDRITLLKLEKVIIRPIDKSTPSHSKSDK